MWRSCSWLRTGSWRTMSRIAVSRRAFMSASPACGVGVNSITQNLTVYTFDCINILFPAGSNIMALTTPLEDARAAAAGAALARVAIAGATGYAGQELVRLLARHPRVTLTA